MKKILLVFCIFFISEKNVQAIHCTIIESLSANIGHDMDVKWDSVVKTMGMTSTIVPNNTLDNNSFFAGTDILIVASGVIALPPNRINTIMQFIQQGGMVYLQTEYDTTYTSNQGFSFIVNTLGGNFTWTGTVTGTLYPTVSGCLSSTPHYVPPFTYFWYGASATFTANIESFLNYQGNDLGFIFCGNPGLGRMITTTDQDWIRNFGANDIFLMENILFNLNDSTFSCNTSASPVLNLGNDSTLCPGDTVVLHAGSGFTSYLWQNGSNDSVFTITGSGTYWLEVTSSCGIYRDSIIFGSGICNVPQSFLNASDTGFCPNTCIDFFDVSTNGPTSWLWSFPGANPTSSTDQNPVNICYSNTGSYGVQLISCNQFGCDTLIIPNFITVDPLPAIFLGNDTLICQGDSVNLFAGPGFNSYFWNTNATTASISVSAAGTYSVIVNSNTCSGTDSIQVNTQQCSPAIALFMSSDTTFCNKKYIDFTDLSTNNPITWNWFFPGAVPSSSTIQNPVNIYYNAFGSFDVTLIACNSYGCDTLYLPSFITEFPIPPVPVITQSQDTLYSTSGNSYAWYNNNNPGVVISTDSFYVISSGGNYFVLISDSSGCQNSSAIFTATSIDDILSNPGTFTIYPNPANEAIFLLFNFTGNSTVCELSMINHIGQIIYNAPILQNQTRIDLKHTASGIYFLRIKTGKAVIYKKFSVNH